MNRYALLIGVLGVSGLLAGCPGGDQKTAEGEGAQGTTSPAKPPTDGLKDLVKEDVVIGKPTRFYKNIKPLDNGDTVWVIYTGRFKDGKVFDTNDPKQKKEAKPFAFTVGTGGVIKGWDEGLLGMLPGGERKLSVPYKLGYNERELPNIPKYSDLYFDVKVLDYVKFGEERTYSAYDQKVGTGKKVGANSKLTIHTLVTDCAGNVIDDTRKVKPVTVTLGKEETFPVIEDGLIGMKEGGVRELSVPPAIGFRADPASGLDGNTLFYVTIFLQKVE